LIGRDDFETGLKTIGVEMSFHIVETVHQLVVVVEEFLSLNVRAGAHPINQSTQRLVAIIATAYRLLCRFGMKGTLS
jgi:hypothetical protein